jgi:SAM-dependent methyltransferase
MLRHILSVGFDRIRDHYHDLRLGIKTSGRKSPADLGIDLADAIQYQPISWPHFHGLLALLPQRSPQDMFIDLGCGMGRALILAGMDGGSQLAFKQIIGVEISPELCGVARRNVTAVLPRLKCKQVSVVCANAGEYRLPPGANVLYFFNPFTGITLDNVLDRTAEALQSHPRKLYVLFYGSKRSAAFPAQAGGRDWLKLSRQCRFGTERAGLLYENTRWSA